MSDSGSTRFRTVAVVLAGGTGLRVGLDTPKQLLKVAGRTVLEHTIEVLNDSVDIDEIVVVMAADYVEKTRDLLAKRSFAKSTTILPGGGDRSESTRVALASLGPEECNVLLHDAVRPLLPAEVIRACVRALEQYDAVDVAIPSADTIVRVDDDDHVVEIPDRSHLRRGQTPQGFRLSVIRRAYELAAADPGFTTTDDCGVVLRYLPEVPIYVVRGDEQNMKVTYPIDLFLLDKLFQLGSSAAQERSAADLVRMLRGKIIVVFGGSYGIGADVARLAEEVGCQVHAFSRGATGTYVERRETIAKALRQAIERSGRIDAVVLTAAKLARGPLTRMTDREVEEQIAVNYGGPVSVARAAEPYLRESKGHLVLFTSSSYTRGRAGYAVYSSTKAAVVNLAQALADEWSDVGIHVNVVNPERTRTPMRSQAFGTEPDDSLLESTTVAATVLDVIASDMTGHVVDVRREVAAAKPITAG